MSTTARNLLLAIAMIATVGSSQVAGLDTQHDVVGPGTQGIDFYGPGGADGTVPLIVILHGGGDHGNDGMEALAEAVAARGAVVALPTYFSGQPRSQNDATQTFEDVVCSIRYARSVAPRLGADADNLIVVGFSYGGFPATALALAPADAYDFACSAGTSHVPRAVVGLGGAYYYDNKVSTLGWSADYDEFLTFGNLGRNTQVAVSLVHGARDMNSPVDHAEDLFATLDEAGYVVSLEILDTRHAELIDPDDAAGSRSVEAIMAAASGNIDPGRTGPATTSVYARLGMGR